MVGGIVMTLTTVINQLQDNLEAIHTGTAPNLVYTFDQVWIGMPEKIMMGSSNVAVVEAANDPNFYYTTCQTPEVDTDVHITLFCKGTTETATLAVYGLRDIVLPVLFADPKVSGTCIGSTVEEVIYGDQTSGKNMVAACRITLRCRM
jgi:hypothetical protein